MKPKPLTDHQGSIRTTIDHFGNVVGYDDYYSFGLPMPGRSSNLANPNDLNKFTGHERDNEGGLMIDYMLARNYDPEIGRFMSVDPLAHIAPSWTPYRAFYDNPINFTDPTGLLESPIYDKSGDFLGTDSEGLQGDAIVMDKKDFKQGMDHRDAMAKGTTFDNLPMVYSLQMRDKISTHYDNLPNRIDYSPNFTLTKEIADKHWQGNTGGSLFVNSANIILPDVTTSNFNSNGFFSKNFIWGMSNTGQVFGTLDMTLIDPNTGTVKLGYRNPNVSPNGLVLDRYDFTYDGRLMRDFATWVGKPFGTGKAFDIHGYGVSTVPVK